MTTTIVTEMYQQIEILQTVIIASKVGSIAKQAHRASFLICICTKIYSQVLSRQNQYRENLIHKVRQQTVVFLLVTKQTYKGEENCCH